MTLNPNNQSIPSVTFSGSEHNLDAMLVYLLMFFVFAHGSLELTQEATA